MTNDYLDTEDQYGSMLNHIDYMVLLACAVTKTDTVCKVRSPYLVHRDELLFFPIRFSKLLQLHITSLMLKTQCSPGLFQQPQHGIGLTLFILLLVIFLV